MSLINISNLTFSYDTSHDTIFDNVSFQIDSDWKLGFIGRNGKGKTTFLNLLLGKYQYSGTISASVDFSYFPFEVNDKHLNTIDNLYHICDFELWELQREMSLLEVSEDVLYRPFNTLSNGEQTKVLLAILFLKNNNFLLIDEPTNHLDSNARQIVSDYLKRKKGFILVSHDRAFLDNCVDHILSINNTNIEIQRGNYSSWRMNKDLQDHFELAENQKLQKEISKLSAAAKRSARWADKVESSKFGEPVPDRGYIGHKSAKMMKRAKVIEARQNKMIEEKSKLLKNLDTAESLAISPLAYKKQMLIEVADLSVLYGDKAAVQQVDFTINSGDRVVLCGKNGSGKTSILKLLLGQDIKYTGTLNIGTEMIVSYVPQDTSFLKGDLKDFAIVNNIDESLFKTILRKLDFSRIQFEKDISEFSGGQKKKVLIAKSLCQKAHLYIWDEPLNYIDILSRIQIEELILKYMPTMVFVEHDKTFIENIATKKVYL